MWRQSRWSSKVGTDPWAGPVSRVCHLCGHCARFHAVVAALKFLIHFEHGPCIFLSHWALPIMQPGLPPDVVKLFERVRTPHTRMRLWKASPCPFLSCWSSWLWLLVGSWGWSSRDAVVCQLVNFLILLESQRFPLSQREEWKLVSWKEFDSLENLFGKELLACSWAFSSF